MWCRLAEKLDQYNSEQDQVFNVMLYEPLEAFLTIIMQALAIVQTDKPNDHKRGQEEWDLFVIWHVMQGSRHKSGCE